MAWIFGRISAIALLLGVVLCIALAALAGAASAHPLRGPSRAARARDDSFVAALLGRINEARQAHGLRKLVLSTGLTQAGADQAQWLIRNGVFSHGSAPAARIRRYYPGSIVGETLLWRSPDVTPSEAVAMWLASSEHRAILLSRAFRKVGFARLHSDDAAGAYGNRPATVVVGDFGAGA